MKLTFSGRQRWRWLGHRRGRSIGRGGVAAVVAAVGAVILLWPSTETELAGFSVVGRFPGETMPVVIELDTVRSVMGLLDGGAGPGGLEVTFDRQSGRTFTPGSTFTWSGLNGNGWLHIEATDPSGRVVLLRDVPPEVPFEIPAGEPDFSLVQVVLDINPIDVARPDDPGRARLTVVNRSLTDTTLSRFMIEGLSDDASQLTSEAPDSCRELAAALPVRLAPFGMVSCTFDVRSPAGPDFAGVAFIDEYPGMGFSSEPAFSTFTDRAEPQSAWYPGIPAAPVVPDLYPQIDRALTTDADGVYRVGMSSLSGGHHASLDASAPTRHIVLPAGAHPHSWVGIAWLISAAGLLTLGWGRLSGTLLLLSGAAIPLLLWFSDKHIWYWVIPSGAVAVATMTAAALGAAFVTSRTTSTWRLVLGVLLWLLSGFLALIAVATGAMYEPINPPYYGDYQVKGLHVLAMSTGVVLATLGGLLVGRPRKGPGAPRGNPDPGGSRPTESERARDPAPLLT